MASSAKLAAHRKAGFTLIETLVAVSILSLSIVAPMSLAAQSLASAYYARDQVTAFYLAQEGIEAVRSIRDANVLENSQGTNVNLLNGIPTGAPFLIDTRDNHTWTQVDIACGAITAVPLKTDGTTQNTGTFYGYGTGPCNTDSGWVNTYFYRTLTADFVPGTSDEIKLTSKVVWYPSRFTQRSVTVTENLYRWVNDGSGQQ